jgi:hypothetical protein
MEKISKCEKMVAYIKEWLESNVKHGYLKTDTHLLDEIRLMEKDDQILPFSIMHWKENNRWKR